MTPDQHLLLPPGFPVDDLRWAAARLTEAGVCVPGYISWEAGAVTLDGALYSKHVEGEKTTLLPDRNVVSRWVQTMSGHDPLDGQHRLAAALLAFAQHLDMQIEPSIAFHELAYTQGMDVTEQELAWFRIADNHSAEAWLDFAMGRTDTVAVAERPAGLTVPDLRKPLNRWRRNYILALKVAELALSDMDPEKRARTFIEWMYRDFILGGPAAMLALVYFAPLSPPKKRLFKSLRSADRERAIDGIKNATWDLTHLSEFARRINENDEPGRYFVLTSFDDGLRRVARLLAPREEDETDEERVVDQLREWWPVKDAEALVSRFHGYIREGRTPEWYAAQKARPGDIDAFIAGGEAAIRNWSPPV